MLSVLVGAMVCGCLLLTACAKHEAPSASVDDGARLLTTAETASIEDWHAALLAQYDIDFRVLTIGAADDLGQLAARSFEDWAVGGLSRTGRGLLLVVDPGRGRVRLEVARELEGVYVDSFVSFVEREQMAPFFAAGRVGDGIVATSELIADRAEEGIASASLDERGYTASSAGAGAESEATIGSGYQGPTPSAEVDTNATADPVDTIAAYLAAMAAHDATASLDLYTVETRATMAGHVVTRAQMDNIVRAYRDCPPPRVRRQGDFAVVDHPGDLGGCAPWFLERGVDGLWRLDLLTMQRAVRFDTRNHWHIAAPEALGDYAFAFDR
jgi:uncharacterized protein